MLSFNKDSIFNLRRVSPTDIHRNAEALLLADEDVLGVYVTLRDQVIFTDRRIITVDVKGVTGKKQEIFSLPYANIQYFAIQTPGFAEILPDSELMLYFNNGIRTQFEFKGGNDILDIGRTISEFILAK